MPADAGDVVALVSGKELALKVNETPATIDHWSDVGVLVFTRRGRRRLYDPEVNAARCERIRRLQQDGMSLATMRRLFDAGEAGLEGEPR